MRFETLIPKEQFDKAFEGTHFGTQKNRELIKKALLKNASGYANGFTIEQILIELGLMKRNRKLTKLGKEYLYEAFCSSINL
jgi:hypothetical protein